MRVLFATVSLALLMSVCGSAAAQERGIAFSVAWSPDGEMIAVGSKTGIWFFDTDFNEIGYLDLRINDQKWTWPISLRWNPDGDLLAVGFPVVGDDGGDIQIIEVSKREVITRINVGDWGERLWSEVVWHPTRNLIAAGGYSRKAFIWDALTGEAIFEFEESAGKAGWTWNSTLWVCWLAESVLVIVTQWETYVVDVEEGLTLHALQPESPLGGTSCYYMKRMIERCGESAYIESCDTTRPGTIWQALSEVFRDAPASWGPYDVHDLEYSPDGRTLATIAEGCLIRLTDVRTGQLLAEISGGIIVTQDGMVNPFRDSLAWRPDSSQFAAVGQFGGISVWDAVSYELIRRFEGFELSYEETSSVYLKNLEGDALEWFNALKARCVDGLKSGRVRIIPLTEANVSPHKK